MSLRMTLATPLLLLLLCLTVAQDQSAEVRGFPEYDTWKPSAQSSTPDVILIKQKEPDHHHHHGSSLSSLLKDNLPLLALLAPLAAVAVLFPLKTFLGPNLVLYPPATPAPPAPPAAYRASRQDGSVTETQTVAAQILAMIDEMDKVYAEMANKEKP